MTGEVLEDYATNKSENCYTLEDLIYQPSIILTGLHLTPSIKLEEITDNRLTMTRYTQGGVDSGTLTNAER